MKYIDIEHWSRKEHFQFFSRRTFPFYNITLPLDVTNLYKRVKEDGLSFYYAMTYIVTNVMSGIEDFRYKIRNDGVVIVDRLHPSFVTFDETTHLLKIIDIEITPGMDLSSFCAAASKAEREMTSHFSTSESSVRDDFVYISCTPWFSFTSMSHAADCNPNDSAPRIAWGKFEWKDGKVTIPFNVQLNHRLLDGYHVHLLMEGIENFIQGYQEKIS
ncbi:CatA-like O-acetyltransferase [Anoxybacterium hadale]|uniref:CatA-like O-acetyltransferase n=1 Tax=Anoxybacterium hadale TaxID=3408580 RepID=UPI003AFFC5D7